MATLPLDFPYDDYDKYQEINEDWDDDLQSELYDEYLHDEKTFNQIRLDYAKHKRNQ